MYILFINNILFINKMLYIERNSEKKNPKDVRLVIRVYRFKTAAYVIHFQV